MDNHSNRLFIDHVSVQMGIIGYCETLEYGAGFIRISGWVAWANKTPVMGNVDIRIIDGLLFNVANLSYRRDVEKFGVPGGRCGFSAIVRNDAAIPAVTGIYVVTDGEQEFEIPVLGGFPRPFVPFGSFSEVSSEVISGYVFDPQLWLSKAPLLILIDNKFEVPVMPECADFDLATSGSGRFTSSNGEEPKFGFSIRMNDVLRLVRGKDFAANLLDGLPHSLLLISSGHEIAVRNQILEVPGKGKIERILGNEVVGWAVPHGGQGTVELEIMWDGATYATIRASQERADLMRLGMTKGGGGFKYVFTNAPGDLPKGEVSVRIKNSATELGGVAKHELDIPTMPRQLGSLFFSASQSRDRPVAIVIPIYNAASDLIQCLQSVALNTTWPAHLILIDDASSDPAVAEILAAWRDQVNVTLLQHTVNRGFTATVNEGISVADGMDVVLLNSDTIVGPFWLQHLRQAAYSSPRIATATAISNNAGAFSVPEMGTNALPSWLDAADFARLAVQAAGALIPQVPTGNGFCMLIRRESLDCIGNFDVEAFPRGYGEENDFCMRALRAGFSHVVDDRCFVYHKRSASFGEKKWEYYDKGLAVVAERYPEYAGLITTFSTDPAKLSMRWRIRHALKEACDGRRIPIPRLLFVISTQTGGTPQTNRDLMENLSGRYECWLLRSDASIIVLSRFDPRGNIEIERHSLRSRIPMGTHKSEEYNAVVQALLLHYAFELVHIRHIAWHGLDLPEICQRLGIPCVFSFHDFYTICPTVKLLDNDYRYCGGTCTLSEGECSAELWPAVDQPPLKHKFIHRWQKMMDEALANCDAFVTTSPSTEQVIAKHLPSVAARGITIIPHGRSFAAMDSVAASPDFDSPLRILLPGNINIAKGSAICNALLDADARHEIEIHALGDPGDLMQKTGLHQHGLYVREDFVSKARTIRPHIGAIFSIWPETYCHTLTEMWAAGVPVVALDYGAVGERIRQHGGGWLLPVGMPIEELYRTLIRLRRSRNEVIRKREDVYRWQASYGRLYDARAMSDEYDILYRRIVQRRRVFKSPYDAAPNDVLVVLVISPYLPQGNGHAPASTHVRIVEPTMNAAGRKVLYRYSRSIQPLVERVGSPVQAVLVQRDIIGPEDMDVFLDVCRGSGIKIFVDCDDDLTSVPDDKDARGRYQSGREALRRLIQAADLVFVSTEVLAATYRRLNSNVQVLQNRLSARLWDRPLAVPAAPVSDRSSVTALYMGTVTHDSDLALLAEPVRRIREVFPDFRFRVIGGKRTDEAWFERVDCPDTPRNYPEFVTWFRNIALQADFALAALEDSAFNACKSDLKFLDYAAAGLAGIYSDVPSYNQTVRHGETGILTKNTTEAWVESLTWMISNPSERSGMAARAHRLVVQTRMPWRPGVELDNEIQRVVRRSAEPAYGCRQAAMAGEH